MYRIGIIDDAKGEREDIQVSIWENVEQKEEIEFKEYELEARTRAEILDEIREDIEEEYVQALIVDFRLDTTADVIEGWEIIEFMHEETPEFPVVIMTNAPDESKRSKYTDADKVYAKKIFLKPELEETKELVNNIVLNMQKYMSHRRELETSLTLELKKLDEDGTDQNVLENVIRIENELGKYKQIYQTTVDTVLNMSDLKEAFEELEKYKNILG